ncbi:MAG: hypothetical protein J0H62_06650 [Rhizobiales bacterium]|nr:hypothetical protein [Hyphomicrobiales bacterium]
MDTLHTVLRAIRGETTPPRRDHMQVFREFLGHIERIGKRAGPAPERAAHTRASETKNTASRHGGGRGR